MYLVVIEYEFYDTQYSLHSSFGKAVAKAERKMLNYAENPDDLRLPTYENVVRIYKALDVKTSIIELHVND